MTYYETSILLSLRPEGEDIFLVARIKLPQINGRKLIPPQSHIFDEGDKSIIKFIFTEEIIADTETVADTHFEETFNVFVGKCSAELTDNERSLGTCAEATLNQENAILSHYYVSVEIEGETGRKTVACISDDADIDLSRKSFSLVPGSNSQL